MNPYQLLRTLGYPVAYMKFDEVVPLPYLVYRGGGSSNLVGDNRVLYSDYNYTVEYYFDKKSTATERKIEELFNVNEIPWSKSEDIYIDTENIFLINYYI